MIIFMETNTIGLYLPALIKIVNALMNTIFTVVFTSISTFYVNIGYYCNIITYILIFNLFKLDIKTILSS